QYRNERNAFAYQTDMHYQVMRWNIDPSVKYVSGEITYYFKSLAPDLESLILDLSTSLQVNSITRNSLTLNYVHSNDQLLTIDLDKVLQQGDYDTLTINYEGVPPTNGFGSFEQSS